MKLYTKKGRVNYKEAKLIRQIEAAIKENPALAEKAETATTFEQLKSMHNDIVAVDAEFEDIPKGEEKTSEASDTTSEPEPSNDTKTEQMADTHKKFTDPFNEEEPIIRDYVLKDEFATKTEGPAKTSFEEPVTFDQSFSIPDANYDSPQQQGNQGGGANKPPVNNQSTSSPQQSPSNPGPGGESSGKKKRRQERLAKYLVKAVCMLCEKGYVWYATKDITEMKLAEYELKDEMDLSVLVTLDNQQEVTVKKFFSIQRAKAIAGSKWTKEEKEDLTDALVDVFVEKNIEPTASQNLALVAGEMLVNKGMDLLISTSETQSILNQLRAMKSEETEHSDVTPPRRERQQQPEEETFAPDNEETEIEQPKEETPVSVKQQDEVVEQPVVEEIGGIIEKSAETKE